MSITSQNAVIMISVGGLFDTPQQLQQFSAENIFETEQQSSVETAMGVDGNLTGGFVNVPTDQNFSLMADSPSIAIFEQWFYQQKALGETLTAAGTIILSSVGKKWAMRKGYLVGFQPLPQAQRTLQAQKFAIRWQSAVPQAT